MNISSRFSKPARKFIFVLPLFLIVNFNVVAFSSAQSPKAVAPIAFSWDKSRQGSFVTAIVQDARGRVVVGTEDKGLWRCDVRGKVWTQIIKPNETPSTRIYALACDRLGRLWIGTQNGVAILITGEYAHDKITTYKTLDGLSGERVFSIAVSPQNGDIWIGTNAGLTRYKLKTDRWQSFTRANGLPTIDVCALAFAPDGTLFAGTQTDGLAIASPKNDYATWKSVGFERALPLVGGAQNQKTLPSGQIDAIRVLDNGQICVATPTGLALSSNQGRTWNWTRGANWAAKVRERWGGAPADWKETPSATLPEDYVSALASDRNGNLFIGTRRSGMAVLHNNEIEAFDAGADYIRAFLPLPNGSLLVGSYGGGLKQVLIASGKTLKTGSKSADLTRQTPTNAVSSSAVSPGANTSIAIAPPSISAFPTPAASPTLLGLNALLADLSRVPSLSDDAQPPVTALPDDWITGGTQLGRYGRYWFCGCAMYEPTQGPNYVWGAGDQQIEYTTRTGPNINDDDSLRYWITSLYSTEVRSLEMPSIWMDSRVLKGYTTWPNNRRQSEADDHGEAYSMNRDGPGVYVNLKVPSGLFVMSLYDFNKDGWSGDNRFRDYTISIRPHNDELNITQITNFQKQPELARGTIRDFVGGVWKRFLVRGPQELTVEVNRNYSFNTILAAVTLDKTDEEAAPYFHTSDEDRVLETKRAALRTSLNAQTPLQRASRFAAGTNAEEVAERVFTELQRTRLTNATYWARENRRYTVPLARFYRDKLDKVSILTPKEKTLVWARLGSCLYALNLFDDWENLQRQRGLTPSRDIERALRWNGINDDHRTQGLRFINQYLKLKADLGLLALDPQNLEAEQTRQREAFLTEQIENLRFYPPTNDMMNGPFMKPGAKLKERSPEEYARLKAQAQAYKLGE